MKISIKVDPQRRKKKVQRFRTVAGALTEIIRRQNKSNPLTPATCWPHLTNDLFSRLKHVILSAASRTFTVTRCVFFRCPMHCISTSTFWANAPHETKKLKLNVFISEAIAVKYLYAGRTTTMQYFIGKTDKNTECRHSVSGPLTERVFPLLISRVLEFVSSGLDLLLWGCSWLQPQKAYDNQCAGSWLLRRYTSPPPTKFILYLG